IIDASLGDIWCNAAVDRIAAGLRPHSSRRPRALRYRIVAQAARTARGQSPLSHMSYLVDHAEAREHEFLVRWLRPRSRVTARHVSPCLLWFGRRATLQSAPALDGDP